MLDVRKPIGYLFLIIGALLTVFAVVQPQITELVTEAGQTYRFNLNLPCGISMFIFGAVMQILATIDAKKEKNKAPHVETPPA